MTAISYNQIKITTPWEIQSIYEITITKTLNHHAELHFSALITEKSGGKAGFLENFDDKVKLYIEDGADKKYLFKGRLKDANARMEGGTYIVTATFLSQTSMLDSKEKSRSFQDTSLIYSDIVAKILADYPGKDFELTAPKTPINGPLIQYQETDWQFIKRIASYQQTVVVPDVILDEVLFSFGYPAGGVKTLPEDIAYSSGNDIAAYNTDKTYNSNLIENEYAYYEVETFDELTIGDRVTFHSYEMYVGAVTIELKNGLLVYKAKLVRKMTLRQNPIYNRKIKGISLAGKVLALQKQVVKLHLAIDQKQEKDTAHWYPFVPPTTDMMYLMPQLGTIASLYIPGLREQQAIITGSVRTNGASCEKTSDPNTRYLGTEYGQELKLAPGGIYITAGRNNLIANFDDEEGVILSSHKKMVLNAKEEIVIDSKKSVCFNAASQILMVTPGPNGVSMENEIHFLATKVHIDCTDDTSFANVDQPEQKKKNGSDKKKEEKSGIDLGNIVSSANGAIAKLGICSGVVPKVSSKVSQSDGETNG